MTVHPVPTQIGGLPRIVLTHHDPILRRGMRSVIEDQRVGEVVAERRSTKEALEATAALRPDVLVMELPRPVHAALGVLPVLARLCRVVVISHVSDSRVVAEVVRRGAAACLVNGDFSPAELVAVIGRRSPAGQSRAIPSQRSASLPFGREQSQGVTREGVRSRLSPREANVMDRIAQGHSNGEIAQDLVLSEKTVKNHVNHIFSKLGVRNRAQAIVLWLVFGQENCPRCHGGNSITGTREDSDHAGNVANDHDAEPVASAAWSHPA
jgi:DNA-binding NarL/FixJ family response regulator